MRQERARVQVDGVASGRLHDRDPRRGERLAEVGGRADAVAQVLVVDRLPRVPMTAAHAALVFQNLISNALKYQAPGVVPEVTLPPSSGL